MLGPSGKTACPHEHTKSVSYSSPPGYGTECADCGEVVSQYIMDPEEME